jgi:hypothetical protein
MLLSQLAMDPSLQAKVRGRETATSSDSSDSNAGGSGIVAQLPESVLSTAFELKGKIPFFGMLKQWKPLEKLVAAFLLAHARAPTCLIWHSSCA